METTQITEIHPIAETFPQMSSSEFEDLKEDIKERGLLEPIWVYEGKILDGRHRFLACQENEITPTFKEYKGNDPVALVVSLNLKRRHLDESKRAVVASNVATMVVGGDRKSNHSANLLNDISQSQAAAMLNVSTRLVTAATKVKKEGSPELVKAVQNGKLKISVASDIAEFPNSEQVEIVSMYEKATPIEVNKKYRVKADELLVLVVEIKSRSERIAGKLILEESLGKAVRGETKSTWLKLSEDVANEYDSLEAGLYKHSIADSYSDMRDLIDINKLTARANKIVGMLKDATQ